MTKRRRYQDGLPKTRAFKNDGAKRVLLLGLMENVPENMMFVNELCDQIGIPSDDRVKLAADQKMRIILLGQSAGNATHPSAICDHRAGSLDACKPRTFESNRENYERYQADGEPHAKSSQYLNCINPAASWLPQYGEIRDFFMLEELHLNINVVNKCVKDNEVYALPEAHAFRAVIVENPRYFLLKSCVHTHTSASHTHTTLTHTHIYPHHTHIHGRTHTHTRDTHTHRDTHTRDTHTHRDTAHNIF